MKKLLLLVLNLFASISCDDGIEKVILRWIPPEVPELIELPRILPIQSDFHCLWYKLIENKLIDEQGKTFGDLFIYKTSSKECSLIITQFDPENVQIFDLYTPNIFIGNQKANENEPVYAIAHLKSFDLIKTEKNSNSFEFSCQAVFTLPDASESYDNGITEALLKYLVLEGSETLEAEKKKIKGSNRPKRQIGAKDFTLQTDKTQVFKNSKSNSRFSCKIELVDENTNDVVYTKTIFEDIAPVLKEKNCVFLRRKSDSFLILIFVLHSLIFV